MLIKRYLILESLFIAEIDDVYKKEIEKLFKDFKIHAIVEKNIEGFDILENDNDLLLCSDRQK